MISCLRIASLAVVWRQMGEEWASMQGRYLKTNSPPTQCKDFKVKTVDIEAYLHFPYLAETELYESQLPQIARKSPVREATGFDWGHSKKLYKQTSLEPTSF